MCRTIALINQAQQGDKEAREQVMTENAGLVWCVVKRFIGRGTETDDLFQIGNIGLLKAIDKFDFSYDVKFSTYAIPMITGEIKRFLRDDGMIKVSRTLKEIAYKAYKIRSEMLLLGEGEPTLEVLASKLEIEREELVLAIEASNEVESLQKPIYQSDGNEILLMDKLEKGIIEEDKIIDHLFLSQLLSTLDELERKVIYLRYYLNMTQSEVGVKVGISQVQVSRLEKRILKELREML